MPGATSRPTSAPPSRAATRPASCRVAKCGGGYSSEWFWAKLWHCSNIAPETFGGAFSWVELADWIPSVLVGVAGLTFLVKAGGGLYWLIPAAMASVAGGVVNAWLFLVRLTGES